MKNFLRIGQNWVVMPLLLELQRNPHLWNQNLLRTTHVNSPHAQVEDIWLRFNEIPEDVSRVLDEHESIDYPAMKELVNARLLVMSVFQATSGIRLGRAMITKLSPGKSITPHVDSGSHAAYYDRYHLCLQSSPGCLFRGDNEQVSMQPGELWWFQNQSMHEVVNNSTVDRIHLIVDVHH
jgi:hypothetical protein